jgi:hypothetical protein
MSQNENEKLECPEKTQKLTDCSTACMAPIAIAIQDSLPETEKEGNGDTKGQEAQSRSRWNSSLRDQQRHHILEQKQRVASMRVPKVGIKSGQQK